MLTFLRRVGAHPRIEPYVAHALRARAVAPSLPFFAGEVLGRGGRDYTVRRNGARIHIEHGTTDAATMDQAFVQAVYEPTPEAAARLDSLGRPPVVLDLGANIGMFGIWAQRRWPGARVIAVEPLPRNVALLRANADLGLAPGTAEIIAAAASTADGEVHFGGGPFTNGRILADPEGGITVPARDTFALAEGIDLFKFDIEGGEWPIVADPRFTSALAPVVMFEHHPAGAPPGRSAGASAEQALLDAGYEPRRTVPEVDGTGVFWAVRREA
jgi:FkbM family methyltransferase